MDFFTKVYETKSINLAAEKLFITPQGLSTVISKLEKEFNCTLFNRDRAGSVPTECGDILYRYAHNIKKEYNAAMAEIERASRLDRGTIRFGYSFGAMAGVSIDYPVKFQELYPGYNLEYMELPDMIIEEYVDSGELDVGLAAYVDTERFDTNLIYESRILFVPRESSRYYDRERVSASEIADEPITMRNNNFATTRIMTREFENCGKVPEVILNTGGILRSIKMCRENRANTVIIDSVAEQFGHGEIKTIPFKEDIIWPLYLITGKYETLPDSVRLFINFMLGSVER